MAMAAASSARLGYGCVCTRMAVAAARASVREIWSTTRRRRWCMWWDARDLGGKEMAVAMELHCSGMVSEESERASWRKEGRALSIFIHMA